MVCNLSNKHKLHIVQLHIVQLHVVQKYMDIVKDEKFPGQTEVELNQV